MSGEQDREALVALLNQHSANFGSQAWTCRCGKQKPYFGTFGSETHVDHLAEVLADHDRRVRAETDPTEPWGPFEMGGFQGCTDPDPNSCACATDQQPTCALCDHEIEPGESAWSRQWPCYETLPLGHRDQEWDVISWHNDCPDRTEAKP